MFNDTVYDARAFVEIMARKWKRKGKIDKLLFKQAFNVIVAEIKHDFLQSYFTRLSLKTNILLDLQ